MGERIKQTPEEWAIHYLDGERISRDTLNVLNVFSSIVQDPEMWQHAKPLITFQQYAERISGRDPAYGKALIKKTDPVLIRAFNQKIRAINRILGKGLTTQKQADQIKILMREAAHTIIDNQRP